jgi:hypothetical protein
MRIRGTLAEAAGGDHPLRSSLERPAPRRLELKHAPLHFVTTAAATLRRRLKVLA